MTGKLPTRPAAGRPRQSRRRAVARAAGQAMQARPCQGAALGPTHRHRAEARRIDLAAEILDRLDIARHLLRLQCVDTRTALALQLLEQTADDVADLAGIT